MIKWRIRAGTVGRVPRVGYESWLDFYEQNNVGGKTDKVCKVKGCCAMAVVGAVVVKVKLRRNQDRSWYIVPLCRKCSQKLDSFELDFDAFPVSLRLTG
jgi:hypothetical protein